MAEIKLKPCSCGGKAILFENIEKYYKYHVECSKCGSRTPKEHIDTIAIAQWNRRANDGRG